MKKLLLFIGTGILAAACGGVAGSNTTTGNSGPAAKPAASGSAIAIKLKDGTVSLEPKTAYVFSDDWTINMPGGKAVPTATREIVIANYDLETTYGKSSAMKKMTAPDQVRLVIQLQDKADVKKDMPVTTGEYAGKMEEFSRVQNVFVYTFAGGTDKRTLVAGSNSDNKGSVKITSVTGDTVSGEIDLSNTDSAFKGSFTAKVWKNAPK